MNSFNLVAVLFFLLLLLLLLFCYKFRSVMKCKTYNVEEESCGT